MRLWRSPDFNYACYPILLNTNNKDLYLKCTNIIWTWTQNIKARRDLRNHLTNSSSFTYYLHFLEHRCLLSFQIRNNYFRNVSLLKYMYTNTPLLNIIHIFSFLSITRHLILLWLMKYFSLLPYSFLCLCRQGQNYIFHLN